jgi:imidazole glycerol-phosphate synthase subunit HisH
MNTIIDYGMGNLGSVKNMFDKIGEQSVVTSDKEVIKNATKLILPGVGAFDSAIVNLHKFDIFDIIEQKVLEEKTPIMGICLGMQLLTKGSEEGVKDGFGFIDAEVKRFHFDKMEDKLFIPHMGWNIANIQKESKFFSKDVKEQRFYFVHSYAVQCNRPEDILTTTKYGYEFVSGFEKDNISGFQFHPEKSHKYGMQLFKNFSGKKNA